MISPKIPQRFYYKFGKPITTEGLYKTGLSKNDDDVQAMYETVKSELEDNIEYLLRRRADDPFKDTGTRQGHTLVHFSAQPEPCRH